MSPPLNPVQAGFAPGSDRTPINIELYLDLICPFSRKMFAAVFESGRVWRADSAEASDWMKKVTFVIHQVPQPWHPQSSYVHEAALAVKHIAPDQYIPFCSAVYKAYDAGKFQDADTWNKSRQEIYGELEALAAGLGVDIGPCLKQSSTGECNAMTQHMKWAVKYHRSRGIHVTPTVHANGLEAGIVSSGWGPDEWLAFLEPCGGDHFTGSKLKR